MPTEHELLDLWDDWKNLYLRRSRLFHGGASKSGEQRADYLMDSELNTLAHEAMALCGRIFLSWPSGEGSRYPVQPAYISMSNERGVA